MYVIWLCGVAPFKYKKYRLLLLSTSYVLQWYSHRISFVYVHVYVFAWATLTWLLCFLLRRCCEKFEYHFFIYQSVLNRNIINVYSCSVYIYYTHVGHNCFSADFKVCVTVWYKKITMCKASARSELLHMWNMDIPCNCPYRISPPGKPQLPFPG